MTISHHDGGGSAPRSSWNPLREFETVMGVPASDNNAVQVLRNGDEIFPAMLDAIRSAIRSVDLLTFVYWTGDIAVEFAESLAQRAASGVRVRVLLDRVGARRMDHDLIEKMTSAGCRVEWFRPVDDVDIAEAIHRTHRKVLICDEQVGFTGGVGIAEEWTGDARGPGEWRDTHFQVRGPAVDGLRAAFLRDWAETGAPLFDAGVDELAPQPTAGSAAVQVLCDDDQSGFGLTGLAFRLLLTRAERCLRITTAYFTPDDATLDEICAAVERGVQVQILVPGEHADKSFIRWAGQSDYQRLLDAGVTVRTFDVSMLHAKVMTADGRVAVVGSSNINTRSLSTDNEVLLVLFDDDLVAELDRHFDEDRERSTELDPADWGNRGIVQRSKEAIAGVVERVL